MTWTVRVVAERLLVTIKDATVREVSRFGETELMRAFYSSQMESLTLAATLLGKEVSTRMKVEPLKAQLEGA